MPIRQDLRRYRASAGKGGIAGAAAALPVAGALTVRAYNRARARGESPLDALRAAALPAAAGLAASAVAAAGSAVAAATFTRVVIDSAHAAYREQNARFYMEHRGSPLSVRAQYPFMFESSDSDPEDAGRDFPLALRV